MTSSEANLDHAFYASFYEDLAGVSDKFKIFEHYINIGKAQGRVANKNEFAELMCELTSFDVNIYSNLNLAFDFKNSLKEKNPGFNSKIQWLSHFFGEDGKSGNLRDINRYRIKNSNELLEFNNEWNELHKAIDTALKFDHVFYSKYYDVPAAETRYDLFIHWLTTGLFLGYAPNEKCLFDNKKVLNDVMEILIKKKVDINYITNEYTKIMESYFTLSNMNIIPNLGNVEKTLFLFLNSGFKLRLFFNENERKNYIDKHMKEYENANTAIKQMKVNDFNKVIKLEFEKSKYVLEKYMKQVIFKDEKLKLLPIKSLNSLANLKHLTNAKFIENFKKCHNLSSMVDVAIKVLKHELNRYEKIDVNSMEIKNFILNFVYNANLADKKDKYEYIEFVKNMSIEIMKKVMSNETLMNTIEKDVEFLITNKKIIKLCKIAYTVALALL